jgi:hypothetical protein
MKPNFLFHVPGCKDLFDTGRHEFLYDNNWLTLEQLKDMPQEFKPETVEVILTNGKSREKLGSFSISAVLAKFGN